MDPVSDNFGWRVLLSLKSAAQAQHIVARSNLIGGKLFIIFQFRIDANVYLLTKYTFKYTTELSPFLFVC